VTCGQAIHLINDLIDNTIDQERLVEWKMLHKLDQPPDKLKTIGNFYWYAFLQRHTDHINTKRA
jgi:hypothetical protein